MIKPTLIVMAAGVGSRYGGLKQIDPVGPSREIILDYSAYDAIKAGFGRIVFVIKEEMEALFKEQVGNRIADSVPVDYVFQRLEDIPEGFAVPPGRKKPWGTGHAVYCCRNIIDGPVAIINADDFYGADAFIKVADFLRESCFDGTRQIPEKGIADLKIEKNHACMVGYYVENTLTEHGAVARGVCSTSAEGYLQSIVERTDIGRKNGEIVGAATKDIRDACTAIISPGTVVSMNFWGFTPKILDELETCLSRYLWNNRADLDTIEFYLPYFVNELIKDGKADVKVLETGAKWYGVTYREDKTAVQAAIRNMIKNREYPERIRFS